MERTELELVYDRSTKNKHLFKEVGSADIVQSLYVNKDAFDNGGVSPTGMKLKLVIEEVED